MAENSKDHPKNSNEKSRRILDSVFPPFSDSKREKPRDMIYIAHEKPDTATGIIAGAQHALVLLMVVVYVVIVGHEIGLSEAQLRSFVSLQIVAMGLVTLLQGLQTRFSSGHLMIHTPSIVSSTMFIAIVGTYGLGAAAGAFMVSGIFVFVLARFLPKLQKFFPPEVTGVLLVLLGLELIEGGVKRITELDGGEISISATVIGIVTLGGIAAFSIWGSTRIRVFAIGIGILLGLVVATIFGKFGLHELEAVATQPFFSFPFSNYEIPTPKFILAAILPILLIEVISAIDTIGMGVAIDQLNNSKWRRPDFPMISRLVSCHGIGVFINGLFGTLSSGISSANLGLAHATGVASRHVAIIAGAFLFGAAFLPQVASFITKIPQPIRGSIIIYTAAYMLVSGMQLILSRMLNNRRMFMVGFSLCTGGAIILMPELTEHVSTNLKPVLGSGLTVGVVTAIILNMIFRIGISQKEEIELEGLHSGQKATTFLEDCGASWGARGEVIAKAGLAVEEALEALYAANVIEGPATLRATFDEYKVVLDFEYPGRQITFASDQAIDLNSLMEDDTDDEAIDAAMAGMSGRLLNNLANIVTSSEKGGRASLRLQFEH